MAKTDAPPLNMTVEHGPRLSPATAFDAERLASYRPGTSIRIQFVDTADRVGIKKWWAILNRAVKDCSTPWKSAQQASEAIKLSLGIVNLGKTINGKMMQWPRSLTELNDAELEDAIRDMMDVLYHVTGVDPAEWRKQTADVGRDQPTSPGAIPPERPGEGSGGVESPQAAPAPPDQATEGTDDAADADADNIRRLLMAECIENFLRDAFSLPAEKQIEKINKLEEVFLEPQNLGAHPDFVKRCAETTRRIVGKAGEKERAREYLKGLIR